MSALGHKRTYPAQDVDLAARWFRTIYEEFEIFPLGRRKRNSESGTLTLKSDAKDQVDGLASRVGVHPSNCWKSTCHVQFHAHNFSPLMSNKSCPLYPESGHRNERALVKSDRAPNTS